MLGVEQKATVSDFSRPAQFQLTVPARDPTKIGTGDWEEFSCYGNSMDFNNRNCEWRPVFNWTVAGSDYKIPEM